MTRQKQYELHAAETRRKWDEMRERERRKTGYYTGSGNTLGPQEDVVESRRGKRNRVVVAEPRVATTKLILAENMLLLALLILSIYGLYRLSIYLLNQT